MEERQPEILYKYTQYNEEYIFDTLEKGRFLFRSAETFNDPFDSNPCYKEVNSVEYKKDIKRICKERGLTRSQEKEMLKNFPLEKYRKKVNDLFLSYRWQSSILSVSGEQNNIKMWSHYARNHSGLCVGVRSLIGGKKKFFYKVDYTKARPFLNRVDLHDEKERENFLRGTYLFKSDDWLEEDEYRFLYLDMSKESFFEIYNELSLVGAVSNENGKKIGYLIEGFEVVEVYLGVRFEGDLERVKQICIDKKIKLIQKILKEKTYEMDEELIYNPIQT